MRENRTELNFDITMLNPLLGGVVMSMKTYDNVCPYVCESICTSYWDLYYHLAITGYPKFIDLSLVELKQGFSDAIP